MEIIDIINKIAKISIINIFTYIVFVKLINYKDNNYKKVIVVAILSIIEAIIGRIFSDYMSLFVMLFIYLFHSFITSKLTNNKLQFSIIVTLISLAIAYIIYIISIIISCSILKMILPNIKNDNISILFVGIIIEMVIIYRFFKLKRFKDGASFLQNKEKVSNIGIIGFTFIGIAVFTFSLFDTSRGKTFKNYLTIGILIEAICLTIWIRRKITKYYKQKMKEKTIEELQNEIKEKDIEISKILKENKEIATINHKYSNRISALERFSAQILSKPEIVETLKVEFGTEFGDMQEQIKKLSEEYSNEIKDKIKHKNKLEKTGIFGIDNILKYMNEEAENSSIKFDLKLNGNIKYMVENMIEQSDLETLLGDHIKDAIIAIKSSNNTYKSILAIMGIIEDCYEICIYDSGIEFEIDTLLKLGTEAITTHRETGGNGIGFMTTFETLRKTKGSLIIEEKHPMTDTDYTKAVRIRFDGKNEYRINTYRAEKLREQNKTKRIIIKKI